MAGEALGIGLDVARTATDLFLGNFMQERQLQGQKKALKQQNDAAFDLWERTNYSEQVKQLEKAGLNPGLLYGMGGGGGATTQTSNADVDTYQTSSQGYGIQQMAQVQAVNSQTELNKALAAKANAEAAKVSGVDTKVGEATVKNLASLTSNNEAKTELTKLEGDWQKLTNDLLDDNQWYYRENAANEMMKLDAETRKAAAAAGIAEQTYETEITLRKMDIGIKTLIGEMYKANTSLTRQQIQTEIGVLQKLAADRWTSLQDSSTQWGQLLNDQNKESWNRFINDVQESTKLPLDMVEKILQAAVLKGGIQNLGRKPIGYDYPGRRY